MVEAFGTVAVARPHPVSNVLDVRPCWKCLNAAVRDRQQAHLCKATRHARRPQGTSCTYPGFGTPCPPPRAGICNYRSRSPYTCVCNEHETCNTRAANEFNARQDVWHPRASGGRGSWDTHSGAAAAAATTQRASARRRSAIIEGSLELDASYASRSCATHASAIGS